MHGLFLHPNSISFLSVPSLSFPFFSFPSFCAPIRSLCVSMVILVWRKNCPRKTWLLIYAATEGTSTKVSTSMLSRSGGRTALPCLQKFLNVLLNWFADRSATWSSLAATLGLQADVNVAALSGLGNLQVFALRAHVSLFLILCLPFASAPPLHFCGYHHRCPAFSICRRESYALPPAVDFARLFPDMEVRDRQLGLLRKLLMGVWPEGTKIVTTQRTAWNENINGRAHT